MDDWGKLDYNKNSKNTSIVLNTQSFTDLEVIKMSKELCEKFNFDCEVRSNKTKKIIVIKDKFYKNILTFEVTLKYYLKFSKVSDTMIICYNGILYNGLLCLQFKVFKAKYVH